MSPQPIKLPDLSRLARAAARMGLTLRVRGRVFAIERWAGGEPLFATRNLSALADWLA